MEDVVEDAVVAVATVKTAGRNQGKDCWPCACLLMSHIDPHTFGLFASSLFLYFFSVFSSAYALDTYEVAAPPDARVADAVPAASSLFTTTKKKKEVLRKNNNKKKALQSGAVCVI